MPVAHETRRHPKFASIVTASAIACLTACVLPGSARAAVLINGGFETPTFGGNFLSPGPGGEPFGFGWSVTTGNIDVMNGSFSGFPAAYQGAHSLDLVGAGSTGGIAQTFATSPGASYTLAFAYANNPGSGPSAASVQVVSASTTVLNTSISHATSNNGNLNWTLATMSFTAAGSTSTLSFTDTSHNFQGGIYLDEISVTAAAAVSEPAPLACLALGLTGLGALRLRRNGGQSILAKLSRATSMSSNEPNALV